MGRRSRADNGALSERDSRLVWRIAALLIDYPGAATLAMLPDLRTAAGAIPPPAGAALVSFVDYARSSGETELAAHYVETFDLRKRNCLHLTYYAYGDTRKRGMALLRFKHAYRNANVELGEHELPDHLAVVLEFAATVDPVTGRRLLADHRPVLELIRMSLADSGSPYRAVLDAVCATLPEMGAADRRKIAALAAEGPPEEAVGLEPFALDPSSQPEFGGRR
ncbi:nitrate reductase molybdenum cofactor assembly chaperone [Amycolatopsis anabasis]|uniref:nitrate reductase molybdenum cofactor assembly chaperone n=1 Tax=Amycolatopsis anabasis TaxID=1840409 RepID=UPI00131CB1DF|nr:nitrate reductase molybdenum cofactor assembly chaperone [Amycolatopsis anabasis]